MFRLVLLCFLFAVCRGNVIAGNRGSQFGVRASNDDTAATVIGQRASVIDPRSSFPVIGQRASVIEADTIPAGNGLSAASDSILARKDSVLASNKAAKKKNHSVDIYKDTVLKKGSNPRKATILSAAFPGLGQIYNKKYWKLPLVYAAVGIPAYAFFYNKGWYQKCQYALTVTVNNSPADSVAKVDKSLLPFVKAGDVSGLITNRDSFRKNQDYSVLFFILFYGLQVVDATVDAHLKGFNVNDDLSLKIIPSLLSSSNCLAGISLVFDIHKPVLRPLRMN